MYVLRIFRKLVLCGASSSVFMGSNYLCSHAMNEMSTSTVRDMSTISHYNLYKQEKPLFPLNTYRHNEALCDKPLHELLSYFNITNNDVTSSDTFEKTAKSFLERKRNEVLFEKKTSMAKYRLPNSGIVTDDVGKPLWVVVLGSEEPQLLSSMAKPLGGKAWLVEGEQWDFLPESPFVNMLSRYGNISCNDEGVLLHHTMGNIQNNDNYWGIDIQSDLGGNTKKAVLLPHNVQTENSIMITISDPVFYGFEYPCGSRLGKIRKLAAELDEDTMISNLTTIDKVLSYMKASPEDHLKVYEGDDTEKYDELMDRLRNTLRKIEKEKTAELEPKFRLKCGIVTNINGAPLWFCSDGKNDYVKASYTKPENCDKAWVIDSPGYLEAMGCCKLYYSPYTWISGGIVDEEGILYSPYDGHPYVLKWKKDNIGWKTTLSPCIESPIEISAKYKYEGCSFEEKISRWRHANHAWTSEWEYVKYDDPMFYGAHPLAKKRESTGSDEKNTKATTTKVNISNEADSSKNKILEEEHACKFCSRSVREKEEKRQYPEYIRFTRRDYKYFQEKIKSLKKTNNELNPSKMNLKGICELLSLPSTRYTLADPIIGTEECRRRYIEAKTRKACKHYRDSESREPCYILKESGVMTNREGVPVWLIKDGNGCGMFIAASTPYMLKPSCEAILLSENEQIGTDKLPYSPFPELGEKANRDKYYVKKIGLDGVLKKNNCSNPLKIIEVEDLGTKTKQAKIEIAPRTAKDVILSVPELYNIPRK